MHMKKQILFLLAFACLSAQAQLQMAVIQDPDGYTNIREEPGIEFEVIGKAYEDDYFWVEASEGRWMQVYCPCKGANIRGFIHQSRVRMLEMPEGIIETHEENRWKWRSPDLQVEIVSQDFLIEQHEIERSSEGFVRKIDGKNPLGVDGGLPRKEVVSVLITSEEGGFLDLPEAAIKGIFEPNFSSTYIYANDPEWVVIMMRNSDGAGGYTVIWMIENGEYVSRKIILP